MASVKLHVYDLSQGMATQMSPMLLGRQIDGIWHTGIVVFDREYYFGGGICVDRPGATPYGSPVRTHQLGVSSRAQGDFLSFLSGLSDRFSMSSYHLLDNNCNHFSDECARFLVGAHIPQYILDLPNDAMSTPLGQMMRPMIDSMQSSIRDASLGHELQLPSRPQAANTPTAAATAATTAPAQASAAAKDAWSLFERPVVLDKANVPAVVAKLKEVDVESGSRVDEAYDDVEQLFAALERLPLDRSFPALDLLRLAVLNDDKAAVVAKRLPQLLQKYVADASSPRSARMMALRTAANLQSHGGRAAKWMDGVEYADAVAEALSSSLSDAHPLVRKAAGSLALNTALLAGGGAADSASAGGDGGGGGGALSESVSSRVVFGLVERLNAAAKEESVDDAEALLYLAALGRLVRADADARAFAQLLEVDLSRFAADGRCGGGGDAAAPSEAAQAAALLPKLAADVQTLLAS